MESKGLETLGTELNTDDDPVGALKPVEPNCGVVEGPVVLVP